MSFAKNAIPRLKMAFCSNKGNINIIYQLKLKNGKYTSLYSDLEVAWLDILDTSCYDRYTKTTPSSMARNQSRPKKCG